jgi:hypothetical protein
MAFYRAQVGSPPEVAIEDEMGAAHGGADLLSPG